MTTTAQRAVARTHNRNARRITLASIRMAIRAWRRLDLGAANRSWTRDKVGPSLVQTVTVGKLAAARQADPFLDAFLGEKQRGADAPRVVPRAFADTAADGGNLNSLMAQPLVTARTAFLNGASTDRAMQAGELSLKRIVQNEIANAGRSADTVAMVTRPQVTGYVRLLTPPSCGRCAILAGRFYRWSEGFERHPNCDCTQVPATERPDDEELFDAAAAVRAGNVNGLSKADEEAILLGADPAQVINAHSGMYTADGVKSTRSGTTRRGFAYSRFRQVTGRRISQRLRPEAILRIADGDRDEALRLLYLHGYLI